MSGKSPLLCLAIGVITKASLLLQIENESPQLPSTYLGDIGTQPVAAEKIVEVGYATGDNGYCILALTFSLCTEGVA